MAVLIGPAGWCIVAGTVVRGDPMFALEVAGTMFVALWATLVAHDVVVARKLSRALDSKAREASLFGVPFRVSPALGLDAIVVGSIRPRIYVGAGMLAVLSDDEMRAVVLHEDHHRRIRAPLRAAALKAWLRLFGRSARIRDILLDRLTELETLADADAIRRGSSPRSLAGALLKGTASLRPVAFAYLAERRVEQLLERAAGIPFEATGRLPCEWLPLLLMSVAVLACHAVL